MAHDSPLSLITLVPILFLPCFTQSMICLVVLNSRAMALLLIPALIRSGTAICCSSFSEDGRPNRCPAAFALAMPEYAHSSSRSLSNYATTETTSMTILSATLVSPTSSTARH